MERQRQPFPSFPQRSLRRGSTCYQFQTAALESGTVRDREAVAEGWEHRGSRLRAVSHALPLGHMAWVCLDTGSIDSVDPKSSHLPRFLR